MIKAIKYRIRRVIRKSVLRVHADTNNWVVPPSLYQAIEAGLKGLVDAQLKDLEAKWPGDPEVAYATALANFLLIQEEDVEADTSVAVVAELLPRFPTPQNDSRQQVVIEVTEYGKMHLGKGDKLYKRSKS